MPVQRRFRFPSPPLHAGRRAALLAVATVIALAVGVSASLAATGTVYVDPKFNVGAGHDFFGGTMPPNGGNVGLGFSVMPHLTSGADNIAIGLQSLQSDTGSVDNIAIGRQALNRAKTGEDNIAIGPGAGSNLKTGNDNIDIANEGSLPGENKKIRIGTPGSQTAAYLAGVWGTMFTASTPTKTVVVNQNGRLGTVPAASPKAQSKAISRLRDRVGQLATAVQHLRKEVRAGG